MDAKGEQRMGRMVKREADVESDDDSGYEREFVGYWDDDDDGSFKKKKSLGLGGSGGGGSVRKGSSGGGGGRGGGVVMRCCQADNCTADLSDAKQYHKRHKVCEHHAKAQAVLVAGIRQRFCQQCSRFHELTAFDQVKRSCRRRLAGHNERRRKTSAESHAESSSCKGTATQWKDMLGQVDDHRGRIKLTIRENSA
ncbi:hypothetical protein SLA2020_011180 [Shorea laevis]